MSSSESEREENFQLESGHESLESKYYAVSENACKETVKIFNQLLYDVDAADSAVIVENVSFFFFRTPAIFRLWMSGPVYNLGPQDAAKFWSDHVNRLHASNQAGPLRERKRSLERLSYFSMIENIANYWKIEKGSLPNELILNMHKEKKKGLLGALALSQILKNLAEEKEKAAQFIANYFFATCLQNFSTAKELPIKPTWGIYSKPAENTEAFVKLQNLIISPAVRSDLIEYKTEDERIHNLEGGMSISSVESQGGEWDYYGEVDSRNPVVVVHKILHEMGWLKSRNERTVKVTGNDRIKFLYESYAFDFISPSDVSNIYISPTIPGGVEFDGEPFDLTYFFTRLLDHYPELTIYTNHSLTLSFSADLARLNLSTTQKAYELNPKVRSMEHRFTKISDVLASPTIIHRPKQEHKYELIEDFDTNYYDVGACKCLFELNAIQLRSWINNNRELTASNVWFEGDLLQITDASSMFTQPADSDLDMLDCLIFTWEYLQECNEENLYRSGNKCVIDWSLFDVQFPKGPKIQ